MFTTMLDGLIPFDHQPLVHALLALAALGIAAWLAKLVARSLLARLSRRLPEGRWKAFVDEALVRRIANVAPAAIVYAGSGLLPDLDGEVRGSVRNLALALLAFTLARVASHVLDAFNAHYEHTSRHRHDRPIKGFVQMAKILVYAVAVILAIGALSERSPWMLLTGLGAVSAVLLLVFKDSILSLVASVQLTTNDMLRVGDWIQMPALGADGHVVDMALNTVKVQNWDRTITTIPTYRLMTESFCNWRGMQESGARRIKRALLVDQASVRFLGDDECDGLRRIALIDDYLEAKREELDAHNRGLDASGRDPVNARRVTNLGTFRAYAVAYLRAHPRLRQDMTLLVRQLEPGATGLPLEVYCFTADTGLREYEDIQADIFDHLLAVLPRFGLRLYQQPGGADVAAALGGASAAEARLQAPCRLAPAPDGRGAVGAFSRPSQSGR